MGSETSHHATAPARADARSSPRSEDPPFRALIEQGFDVVALVDAAGRLHYVSPSVTRVTGRTPGELAGQRALAHVHPEDVPGAAAVLGRLLAAPGATVTTEVRLGHRDGSWRWVQAIGTNLLHDPAVASIVVNYRDVTEQRRNAGRIGRLSAVTAALSEALTPAQVGEVFVTQGLAALGADRGVFVLLEENGTHLELAHAAGYPDHLLRPWRRFPVDATVPLADAVRRGEAIWVESAAVAAARYPHLGAVAAQGGSPSLAAVPLVAGGRVLGAVGLSFLAPRSFDDGDKTFIGGLAKQCAQALERARLYEAERAARLRAEATRDAAARLAAIVESSDDAIIGKTLDGTITDWNAGAVRLYGYTAAEVVGRPIALLIPPDRRHELPPIMERLRRGERTEHYETVRVRKDGRRRRVSLSISPIKGACGEIVGAATIARDVSEPHRAALEERQRLARELHDSLTQSLYSTTLLAEAGRRVAAAGQAARAEHYLARLGETTQQALKEVRLLVYQLRPSALAQAGRVGALEQRLDAVERRAGVEARVLVEGTIALPPPVEEELYRIAQEALNNALKHAGATTVTAGLRADGERVELSVTDDGRGFALDAGAGGRGGLGLVGMRERAERLGGTLTLRSVPGRGTTVRVTVAVHPPAVRAG